LRRRSKKFFAFAVDACDSSPFSTQGCFIAYAAALALGLFTAQGVSWRERLDGARFMLALRLRNFSLPQDMSDTALLQAKKPGQCEVMNKKIHGNERWLDY